MKFHETVALIPVLGHWKCSYLGASKHWLCDILTDLGENCTQIYSVSLANLIVSVHKYQSKMYSFMQMPFVPYQNLLTSIPQ